MLDSFRIEHLKWTLPLILKIHEGNGAKFVTLRESLGISRESLSVTLKDLLDSNFIDKNKGYGHPMRPEYILTEKGKDFAQRVSSFYYKLKEENLFELINHNKWTFSLITSLENEQSFNDLKRLLEISPRALTLTLKDLLKKNLIIRDVIDSHPPRVVYSLSNKGKTLFKEIRNF